ncbi:MAG: HypC/HybG/HupF family hydrogenase formation chaperone [Planctomycetota bacterium]|nr:HypC/HybG/HupF family hydrogenase formation chaperone [Planctomycetota bacterium]
MCLAIPAKIESIEGDKAVIDLAGARATAVTSLTPQVKVGDWVLVHAGYAITILDEEDARETFAILREMEGLTE